jgi:hypothetical protein
MPTHFLQFLLILLASLSFMALPAQAMTMVDVSTDCPICQKPFPASVPASGTVLGQRLDLRRTGPVSSPWQMPLCPTCGIVLFKEAKDFTPDELKTIKTVMASDAYKAIPKSQQTYHRMALIFEGLKKPADTLGFVWLQASWQVEGDAQLNRQFLAKSLAHYEAFLANPPIVNKDATDEEKAKAKAARMTALFLKGELLRRLEKFKDSKKHFEALLATDEFKASPIYVSFIKQELGLIALDIADPKEIQLPDSAKVDR